MNIVAYCCVSNGKEDQLNSLEAKKTLLRIHQAYRRILARLYADEGISRTKIKNRKEFLRMMADAETGLFAFKHVKFGKKMNAEKGQL
jgi:DNA invertase Pin-like site-specific DNA recombinase